MDRLVIQPQQSVMSASAHFSQVPHAEIERSTFDRSHGFKSTFDSGYLIPVFCDEALPGDTFSLRMSAFARLATPLKPVMDNMFLDSFFFFVPLRLLWDNFQEFMGERRNPDDLPDTYTVPQVTVPDGGFVNSSIFDYMGLPTQVVPAAGVGVAAWWLRAYNLIYNEWFRDENLQDRVPFSLDDGPDDPNTYQLLRRGKRKDYFTSALPWPQKGDAVLLPLGGLAPLVFSDNMQVKITEAFGYADGFLGPLTINPNITNPDFEVGAAQFSTSGPNPVNSQNGFLTNDAGGILSNGSYADLTSATAATINSLRQAFQLQKLFERDARGGTRYTEIIRSHFGVTSPDSRLQRPEYLGGGETMININPVAQTSQAGTTPQGNLAAFGTAGVSGHGFSKSFTEHGVILGLVSVRADLTYQQGLNKMWNRKTRYDFYWPAFSHLGEQVVQNSEIELTGSTDPVLGDLGPFGYQERYAEYRYKPSLITGNFRSNFALSLDLWHLSQDFGGVCPQLGSDFIVDNPPIERIIAVPSEPYFLFDAYFQLKCARPMPVYSVPGLVDHF
jgi:hypothetical protein